VISKTDLCTPESVAQLSARLSELNGYAPIDTAIGGALDPRHLIENPGERPSAGFVGESDHSDGIQSFVWTEAAPLAWPPFERTMETLIALRGSDLLRVKGFLNVAGCRGPVLVQIVQHLGHPPLELAAWPDQDHASRLVFITRNIPQERILALLQAVRALAAEAPGEPRPT
jgi:G3E family GTPase